MGRCISAPLGLINERHRCKLLEGSWGILPKKIKKLRLSKRAFCASWRQFDGNKTAKTEGKNVNNSGKFLETFFRNRNCKHVIYNLDNNHGKILPKMLLKNFSQPTETSFLTAISVSIHDNLWTKLPIVLIGFSCSFPLFPEFLALWPTFSMNWPSK